MRVTVRLFARLRDIAGAAELARDVEPGAPPAAKAHERCPYSNATRGNIEVGLTVEGAV